MQSHTHNLSSHTHGTGNGTYTHFVVCNNSNIACNGTARKWPSGSGNVHYVYATSKVGMAEQSGISGPSNNTSGGPSNNTSGGPSPNASGGPSNNTSSGPSNNTSGTSGALTSGTNGSGTAINIMPPYIAVYAWRRTA